MCVCVCWGVSGRLTQRGDIGRVASAHRHQKEGAERTGFGWCGRRDRVNRVFVVCTVVQQLICWTNEDPDTPIEENVGRRQANIETDFKMSVRQRQKDSCL